ncbi:mechanosensitive ion channel [Riemerella anatipestifer]|nr:mechanosensitive ion channel [Riemerella anatipestifer]
MFLNISEHSFTKSVGSAWDKTYEKLEAWQLAIFSNIPNFIVAIFVFTVSLFLSRLIYKLVISLLYKTSLQDSAKNVIARIVSVGVIMLGLILVLVVLNLNGVLNTILAGAGVMGLAVGLALQGTLSNTFSGIVLSLVKNIRIGDWVSSNNFSGQIVDIDFRMTTIKDIDNNIVLIPNKLVLDSPIKNASLTQQRRLILTCGVGYESDLDKVKEISLETVKKTVEYLVEGEEITFLYTSFGDSAIDFELRCMLNVNSGLQVAQQKSNLITALKKRFDEEGINIPFPIRTFKFEQ